MASCLRASSLIAALRCAPCRYAGAHAGLAPLRTRRSLDLGRTWSSPPTISPIGFVTQSSSNSSKPAACRSSAAVRLVAAF
jgi:hypothetical protein